MAHVNQEFWYDKRVLVTGHTGFKGGWLSLWLQEMGAIVIGVGLEPATDPAIFTEAQVGLMMESNIADIRNYSDIALIVKRSKPEIIIHLAAQPLVLQSYSQPRETYETNVMGTLNILEAARHAGSVRSIVNVTTDKVYENNEWLWAYRENERLGGLDPYSNSKACSELLTESYRRSFLSEEGIALASARAGNVIGGGDWAKDRLVPDTLQALNSHQHLTLRNPASIRPWQHVLEPLAGYLMLAEKLYVDNDRWAESWNFGPEEEDAKSVEWVAKKILSLWGSPDELVYEHDAKLHEAKTLKLCISKAKSELSWRPRYRLEEALELTVAWYKGWVKGGDAKAITINQIREYQRFL
jgi:CDP-glucose 4,6-dehydratase